MVLNPVISRLNGKLIVLASASPRRLEILTNVGLRFEAVPSWFKETLDKSLFKTPYEYAMETAKQKALEVAERMPFKHLKTPDIVIGADTVVTVDGLILEKPVDKEDAYRMLSRLSGKEHSVFTGVSLVLCHEREGGNTEHDVVEFYEETKVKFAELSEEMLWEYINSGEPMDKAGGYGIQALGGMLVEYVHGDFLNVVGFPLNHFCRQLGKIYNAPPKSPAAKMGRENLAGGTNTEQSSSASIVRDQTSYSDVFPGKLLDLLEGFKFSKALFTASKLKVFDVLRDSEGRTVEEVATQIQASVLGTERLLDAAVSLDLLHKVKRGGNTVYRNTGQTSQFLVTDGPLSLHEYLLYCDDVLWPMFTHLESAVMQGTNQCEKVFGKKTEHLLQDEYFKKDEVKLRFMKAMHCIATVAGRDVATAFDLSRFKTACDIGGCTGAMAYEFSKAHPGLSVIVFDLPPVIEMRSEFQPKEPNSRVSFIAGDFFKDSLPKADLYILARILHDWSDEKVHELLDKLSKACAPGCGLLVSEIILNDERTKPRSAHLQALSMTEGRQRSASEYNDLLRKHGFTLVQTHYTGNLLGAMLFVKEEPSTDEASPLSSAESVETMIA